MVFGWEWSYIGGLWLGVVLYWWSLVGTTQGVVLYWWSLVGGGLILVVFDWEWSYKKGTTVLATLHEYCFIT